MSHELYGRSRSFSAFLQRELAASAETATNDPEEYLERKRNVFKSYRVLQEISETMDEYMAVYEMSDGVAPSSMEEEEEESEGMCIYPVRLHSCLPTRMQKKSSTSEPTTIKKRQVGW